MIYYIIVIIILLIIISYFLFIKPNNNFINENFENNNKDYNNVFMFWIGNDYKLIKILRKLIYLHSNNEKNYKVHLINHDNIKDYIKDLPERFYQLIPAHQADIVRVNVICDYGGIWLDADTIVLNDLSSLFKIINHKDGFFVTEEDTLCNGVFGSKPNTPLMKKWKEIVNIKMKSVINPKWIEFGSSILRDFQDNHDYLYDNYEKINGPNTIYPVLWDVLVDEYINKPYDNYKNIERKNQPLLILGNSVYKELEKNSVNDIIHGNYPISYFIKKSIIIYFS